MADADNTSPNTRVVALLLTDLHPFSTTGILIVLLAIPALIRCDVILAAMAGALILLWLGYLGWGAFNAARARR